MEFSKIGKRDVTFIREMRVGIGVKVTQRRSLSNIKTKNLDKAKGLGSLASRGGTDFDK